MKYQELEVVVLCRNIPEHDLCIGDLGTIVEVYEPDGLEVEFVTASGRTQALLSLKINEVRKVLDNDLMMVRSLQKAS